MPAPDEDSPLYDDYCVSADKEECLSSSVDQDPQVQPMTDFEFDLFYGIEASLQQQYSQSLGMDFFSFDNNQQGHDSTSKSNMKKESSDRSILFDMEFNGQPSLIYSDFSTTNGVLGLRTSQELDQGWKQIFF